MENVELPVQVAQTPHALQANTVMVDFRLAHLLFLQVQLLIMDLTNSDVEPLGQTLIQGVELTVQVELIKYALQDNLASTLTMLV